MAEVKDPSRVNRNPEKIGSLNEFAESRKLSPSEPTTLQEYTLALASLQRHIAHQVGVGVEDLHNNPSLAQAIR